MDPTTLHEAEMDERQHNRDRDKVVKELFFLMKQIREQEDRRLSNHQSNWNYDFVHRVDGAIASMNEFFSKEDN